MKNPIFTLITNLGLLLTGFLSAFSGFLLQIQYHLGNHQIVGGLSYLSWSNIHKLSIVTLSVLMVFHVNLHWKWFRTVIKKRLFAKNKQVLTLSVIFVLVAITGILPWLIGWHPASKSTRETFIEIHDKIAILLTIYLLLHVIKRLKWFSTSLKKLNQ